MTIENLKNMIEEKDWDINFEKCGIRIQEQPFELGSFDHNSVVWIDGEETEEELDGVCVIDVEAPEAIDSLNGNGYFGNHIALLGGDCNEYGADAGEIILRNAEVLYIIK